ncbi:MAG: cell wall metabolism sensor histidine kinase WalK, partial [Coriobacteriia bacterium]|nr:cell wall metabolism sensor histidine kinase WalK [Coriobacteriia bacterium]
WVALAVAGLLGFAFSDFIGRRVKMLTRAASAIADGDFQQRLPKGLVPDEIRELADVYNRMAVQLGEAFSAVREHEQEISAVVESLAEGVLALDESGVVRLANPASERILRMKAVDLTGQAIENAVIDERVISLAHSGLAGEHAVETVELGNTILLVHATPIVGEGRVDGTVLLLADVTEQKRYEEAQRRFIANASHEMRTPISALKGFIELLESGAKDKADVRDDFLRTMETEVERLSRLVSDLFTLAQIDAGRMELEIEPVPVRALFDDVTKLMSLLAEDADVTLHADLAGDDLAVLCDRQRVQQVLLGFVDNALKHSRPKDRVTLRAARSDSSVFIEVSDTGPGISPDVQTRIFERFYRGAASGETGKGAGLGLSIATEIVQAHGSEIEVESAPDVGATFRFSLPSA